LHAKKRSNENQRINDPKLVQHGMP